MSVFLDRLPYTGELPASFDTVGRQPYAGLGYAPDDEPAAQLCAQLADTHDIIFYTDHWNLRLAGLFPKPGGEVAYFGFWETTGSLLLNQLAFDQFFLDAAARGFRVVQGPLHFSTYFRYRLRLGAVPRWRQFSGEPVNPPYYPGLLEQLGFRPALTFESHCLRAAEVLTLYEQQRAVRAHLAQQPFDFIPLTPATLSELGDELFALVQQIFSHTPAYRAVSREQFRLLYNSAYAAGLCPHTSVLLRHQPSGRLAAFSLCQPNYHSLGRAVSGQPVFARDYPRLAAPRTLLAKTVGVHPDFQGQGLQALLAAYAMLEFRAYYDDVIFCLMPTGSPALHFAKGLSAEVAHYALFEREVGSKI